MTPDLRPIRSVLAALRGRLRGVRMVRAGAWIIAGTGTAIVVSFLLDVLLDLPLAVRGVHLVLVAVALVALASWAFAPLRTKLSDEDLAQALEDVVPDLKDRVASALDFERRLADPAEPESREMMQVVISQAAAYVQKVEPRTLVDARPARRAASLALCAAVAVVVSAAAAPSDFSLWLQRGVLLRDVEWPRRTHVRVLDFERDTPRIVTHGDDVQIVAEATGLLPDELMLHYEALEYPQAGGSPSVTETDVRRMFRVEDETGDTGRYTFQFRAISTSFRFWVTGGDDDDRDPVHVVRAMVPPRIASITARVTYPEYSGLPSAVVREASFQVLEGTHVEFDLVANMPLSAARMVPEDGPALDLPLDASRERVQFDLRIREDVPFRVELTAQAGQSNRPDQDRFLIRALPDRPPHVRVLFPVGRKYRTPNGLLPVKAFIEDDFGLASARLELHTADAVLASKSVFPPAAPAPGAPGADGTPPAAIKRTDLYEPVEIGELGGEGGTPVAAGDVVRLVLRATDNSRQENEAPDVEIEILSPEDLERRLAQKQVGLRDQLTQLRAHQRRTLDGIRGLRDQLVDRPVDAPALDRGRDLQVEQGRVGSEIDQFLRGIHRVFDAYVLNRLGSIPTIDRVLPSYHAALEKPTPDGDEVFPRSLYEEIVLAKRERRLYDPNILGALLDIMDIGDDAVRTLSPSVYDALRTWAGGEDPRPEMLDEAERRAVELETRLRELDRRMDRWEDLNELIELARQITNRQRELSNDAKKRNDKDGDGGRTR